jgi:taurine dioxygenase
MEIKPLSGALGAEILGPDLSQPLGANAVQAIRQALLDHGVVFFRDQAMSPDDYMRFAAYFAEPIEYPFINSIPGYPKIIPVVKLEHEKINFGGIWHSDTAYMAEPPMGSMLYAKEIPPRGGDTMFANMYLAYETLSAGMQRMLAGLKGVNESAKAITTRTREDRMKTDGKQDVDELIAEHPVVRTHPETGRKALYVNVAHTTRFSGMTVEESAPILDFLHQHQARPEFTCRFKWEVGSLAFWDNRATHHNPINDYHGHRRVMHRITLKGDKPV